MDRHGLKGETGGMDEHYKAGETRELNKRQAVIIVSIRYVGFLRSFEAHHSQDASQFLRGDASQKVPLRAEKTTKTSSETAFSAPQSWVTVRTYRPTNTMVDSDVL